MATEFYRNANAGEGEAGIEIQSFSTPGRSYTVSLDTPRSCDCPHHSATGAMCRHILTALSTARIRRSAFGARCDEEAARGLVAAVLDKRLGVERSYDAALEAEFFRFSSPELRRIAWSRHKENVGREKARLERSVVA